MVIVGAAVPIGLKTTTMSFIVLHPLSSRPRVVLGDEHQQLLLGTKTIEIDLHRK